VTPDEVLAIIPKLRVLGVKTLVLAGPDGQRWHVELHPAEPAPEAGPLVPKDFGKPQGPEVCRCGHDETEHAGDGYCLRGCEAAKCTTKSTDESGKP